jgi:hypothetical protein
LQVGNPGYGAPGTHPPTTPSMGNPGTHPPAGGTAHCDQFTGAPRTACEAAAHGGPGPMTGGNHPQGDPCMVVPPGPDRVACYAAPRP